MRLHGIVLSPKEPAPNMLWLRPMQGGVAMYVFNNGCWKPLRLVNDNGTYYTSDDTVADISGIDQNIHDTVTQLMHEHDVAVNDIHYEDVGNSEGYPDITIF